MTDLSVEERECANRRCLNGANCPGHPWREGELDQLDVIEASSRDMNVAAYRGAGFRQAREYSKQREEKLEGALRRADELLMAANGALGRARAHAYDAPDRSILVSALEDTAARLAAVSDTTLTALAENGDTDGLGDRRPGA